METPPYERHNSSVPPGYAPVLTRRGPPAGLEAFVFDIVGYRENGQKLSGALEMAPLVVPLVISFGEPFEIALGKTPGPDDRFASFTSGLFPGYVLINSSGGAECIQIDFTPAGAQRFFGMPLGEITSRMVRLEELSDPGLAELRRWLADTPDWDGRFALAEAFVQRRIGEGAPQSSEVDWAFRTIVTSGGSIRVRDVAEDIGWSRKHFAERFRNEIGLGPKAIARMARFNRALAMARGGAGDGWAGIAAECGYADQAHLVREFRDFSGLTPTEVPPAAR